MTEVPARSESRPTFIACTVATAAELPAVKVLSSSFLANHPQARFLALVVDALPENSGPGLVTPADLGMSREELAELATGCTAAQLCGVLRPKLLEQLLGQGVPVLYLDPWVQVLNPLTELVEAAVRRGPLVLLPRSLRPLPDDGLRPTPTELLETGVFDPGFLLVAPGAEPFLQSLDVQLRRTPDATKAVLDMAPALVNLHVLRDATVGLSVWNAPQRDLHRSPDGALTTLGEPVRSVHFAGFDPQRPWLLSAHFADRPRVLLSEHPHLAELCTTYRAELIRKGHTPQKVRYGFGQLADGTQIPDELRADYRQAARTHPGSAFSPEGWTSSAEPADSLHPAGAATSADTQPATTPAAPPSADRARPVTEPAADVTTSAHSLVNSNTPAVTSANGSRPTAEPADQSTPAIGTAMSVDSRASLNGSAPTPAGSGKPAADALQSAADAKTTADSPAAPNSPASTSTNAARSAAEPADPSAPAVGASTSADSQATPDTSAKSAAVEAKPTTGRTVPASGRIQPGVAASVTDRTAPAPQPGTLGDHPKPASDRPQPGPVEHTPATTPATTPTSGRTQSPAVRTTPPPAFGPDGGAGFVAWASEPAPGLRGSTRWAAALWRSDPALRTQFPDPFGADSVAFRDWCASVGVAAGRLPVSAIPRARAEAPVLHDQLGVSVLGTGPIAELVHAAARASGLPTSTTAGYPVVVRVGTNDQVPDSRFVVDYLMDDDDQPTDANELWVPSETTRVARERQGGPAVRVLPLPVRVADAKKPEEHEGVIFGALANHTIDRAGNVLGAVSAFLSAFPDRTDVTLRIEVTHAQAHPEAAERLRLATAGDPRIELVDTLGTVDCLVHLHRGGADDRIAHTLARHAAVATPILTSQHGAVVELFDKSAVIFVPCRQGVEPDIQAAAKLMHALADDLPAAVAIGSKGREHVRATRDVAKVGELLRERVEHAYRGWRARRAKPSPTVDPMKALHSAKHALLRQPDVGTASRTPMAPQLRKMVLRVLDHYDNHMRDVLGSLVDGVERTVAELVRRQDDISTGVGLGELEVLRAELEQHADHQGHLADQLVGIDDGVVRVRADMAGQGRRLREIEDAVVGEAAKRAKQSDALAHRIDKLAVALERTLDRIDSLESKVVDVIRDRDTKLDSGLRAANQAQQTADALRRVVVREHERHSDTVPRSSLVLTDVGLLRLPSDDAFMLPMLSSNGVWETDLSELIDSVVEPDGIFLDVGAYVGYQTVRMLSRFGTGGAVVAVEPCPSARALLRHNVDVNLPERLAQQLVLVDAAAWESTGELATQPALTGGVSVSPLPEDAGDDVPRVRATRLDKELEAVPALQGRKLSVVRVDAPGRGHRALAGLVRLLRRDRPHVFLEFSASATEGFGDDPVTVLKEFRIWGYDLVPVATREVASPEQIVAAMQGMRTTSLWLRPRPVAPKGPGPQVAAPVRTAPAAR
ncbi:FkbM family methyltransferase [Saccharothrix sp. ALI-22-I]|uniref:FkbM family methyltransferase n=1 Tax=Saccharothrix sp. ALI-22-I TaxID=1933778 RepID=UPI00117B1026|nr:FkbM family methyltransferase [Saccharothrix sp. ALI-22-I]